LPFGHQAMSSARGIRTRTSCGLSAVTPASWSRAPRERIPGIGPGTSPRQGDALPLRHIRVEPPAATDPAASSVPRTCSAIELRRREAGRPGIGPGFPRSKRGGLSLPHRPSPSLPPVPTRASCPYKGRRGSGPEGVVRSAGFEPAASGISGQPLCHVGVRAHGASGRSRTACFPLRGGCSAR
jgi:hypothetical protein